MATYIIIICLVLLCVAFGYHKRSGIDTMNEIEFYPKVYIIITEYQPCT